MFKKLRNKVNKLVKRDKIQTTLSNLGSNPCPSKAWKLANQYLGKGQSSLLPDCTNNSDPNLTAENQNTYFVSKIDKLVSSVHEGKKPFKCESCDYYCDQKYDLQHHVATVHKGKTTHYSQLHTMAMLALTTAIYIVAQISCVNQLIRKKKNTLSYWVSDNDDTNFSQNDFTCHAKSNKRFAFKFVTGNSISKIISRLSNTKALGVDNIGTDIWKKGDFTCRTNCKTM